MVRRRELSELVEVVVMVEEVVVVVELMVELMVEEVEEVMIRRRSFATV